MIKINNKDSIIDVIIKINNCKQKEIVLDFPFGHPIIHNHTSLKILKNKAWKKDLIIITNDKTAQRIWKNLWIKYSKLGDPDLLEYNYTFFEYTKYLFKRYLSELFQIFSNNTPDIIFDYHKKYASWNSKIWFFLLSLIASIFLFIFIFYFAVNKTYIYITPEIRIKTKAENFIFSEIEKDEISNNNIINLNAVSKLVYITSSFWTSWVNENSLKRSKWKITFFNELNEDIALLKNTRVQTDDWIIFTTDTEVNIPKATKSSSWALQTWTVDINITSKTHDSKWKIVWNRSNIWSWVLLSLPWLKTNKDKIYAKTLSEIKWWNDKFTRQLTQEDLDNAKSIIESQLKQQSLNELKKQIQEDNKNNNITYEILWIDDILKYSNFSIIWLEDLKIWEEIDTFELSWTVKISSFTYNTEKVLNQLSNTIRSSMLEDVEKILYINNESLRISNIMSKQERPFEIKATAIVEAFFSHNFLNEKNNYIEKLKSTIWWMDKDEALKTLLNNTKISDVKIDIRPFFMTNISKISDNIIIKVVEKE
jgi:hypothetical protein